MIPEKIKFVLESSISNSFKCQSACNSLDIDIKKKSRHEINIEGIKLPEEWNVGLIYGASGSGKTSIAHHLFGEDCFQNILDENKPIIDQFPDTFTYDQCAELLTGIGLNSVPCWVRPVRTLSNGQRARADAALQMMKGDDVVIDEFTSVVDRTVAKCMSLCVKKFAVKNKKQIILLSCHADIIEWLNPDWIIDCNKQAFQLPANDAFFLPLAHSLNLKSDWLTVQHGNISASIII